MSSNKHNYKLEYFPVRMRGEAIRLILAYAGKQFEDVVLDFEKWGKRKPESVYGHLPILTTDGEELGQSLPICQFLARRYGLDGKNEFETARINAVADFQNDLVNLSGPVVLAWFLNSADKEEKEAALGQKVEEAWPTLVKLLRQSKSQFFADSGLSWADFIVAEFTDSIVKSFPQLAGKFPDLVQHSSRVHSIPQLQHYLKTRKHSDW